MLLTVRHFFYFSLDKLIDSIEFLSDDLKAGRDVKMSQSEVLKKSGEIFALRHVVNLSSDLVRYFSPFVT